MRNNKGFAAAIPLLFLGLFLFLIFFKTVYFNVYRIYDTYTVKGRVVDMDSGQPVAGAQIKFEASYEGTFSSTFVLSYEKDRSRLDRLNGDIESRTQTDKDGSFVFPALRLRGTPKFLRFSVVHADMLAYTENVPGSFLNDPDESLVIKVRKSSNQSLVLGELNNLGETSRKPDVMAMYFAFHGEKLVLVKNPSEAEVSIFFELCPANGCHGNDNMPAGPGKQKYLSRIEAKGGRLAVFHGPYQLNRITDADFEGLKFEDSLPLARSEGGQDRFVLKGKPPHSFAVLHVSDFQISWALR